MLTNGGFNWKASAGHSQTLVGTRMPNACALCVENGISIGHRPFRPYTISI